MAEQSLTKHGYPPTHSEHGGAEIHKGWKYKTLKLGPFKLLWYASPEIQLILVSFVCFLCPGEAQFPFIVQAADYVKACSTH